MRKFIFTLFLTASTLGYAQEAVKVTAAKHNEYGLSYSLPKTMAEVRIEATQHTHQKGPYYLYAEKYLGVSDVITMDESFYEMTDVSISPVGIVNPEETYLVKFSPDNPPSFYLTEDGRLLSINTEPDLPLIDLVTGQKTSGTNEMPAYTALTEEQLAAGSTAKMAEMAAKQIYRIRESRINLVTGDVDQLPADGESFKIIMDQLNEQEKALTEMFIGTKQTKEIVEKLTIDPMEWTDKAILFRFSHYFGVVDTDDLSGTAYYLKANITEDLRPTSEEQIEKNLKRRKKNKGVAYVIPGRMTLDVTSANKLVYRMETAIAQLGEIMQMPKETFNNKKEAAKAIFVPETGAILELIH